MSSVLGSRSSENNNSPCFIYQVIPYWYLGRDIIERSENIEIDESTQLTQFHNIQSINTFNLFY